MPVSPQATAVIRLAARAAGAAPFYSHAERVVGAKVPPVAPAAQVRRTLLNAGVKPEEMKWSGLDARLAAAEAAGEPVRRADLLSLVRTNTPRLEEHVYGGKEFEPNVRRLSHRDYEEPEYDEETGEPLGESIPIYTYEDGTTGEQFRVHHDEEAGNVSVKDGDDNWLDVEGLTGSRVNDKSLTDAENAIEEHLRRKHTVEAGEPVAGPAKYADYQLPGGENYRERLFALHPGEPAHAVPTEHGYDVYDAAGRRYGTYPAGSPDEAVGLARRRGPTDSSAAFRSSHWDEPNVLFHVRHSDRTGPNGEKLLHLDELQSDWHQTGRDKGYVGDPATAEAGVHRLTEVNARLQAIHDHVRGLSEPLRRKIMAGVFDNHTDEFSTRNLYSQYSRVEDDIRRNRPLTEAIQSMSQHVKDELGGLADEHRGLLRERDDLVRQGNSRSGAVPDAPFKKTWHELALRKMIDHAARNGYAGVTWTPGEEHADRYDLAKQISDVEWHPTEHTLRAWPRDGGMSGREIVHDNVTPDRLHEYVGRGLADSLLSQAKEDADAGGEPDWVGESHLENFRMGGEGMKGFYDRIVPQYLDKYGKRFGAAVGTTTIDAGGRGRVAVPHFPVTPALRDAVHQEGQVLYARSPAALAVVRMAASQHPYEAEAGTPGTRWADRPAPANPAAAVVHPGVLFPRVKAGPAPTLRPDLSIAAAPPAGAFDDENSRHHREKAAVYHGMRAAGLPAGGGPAGEDLRDYVMTLARHALKSDPVWADRYRTAAARLMADEVPHHYLLAVGDTIKDVVRRHAADPGLQARVERVKAATAPARPTHPIAPAVAPAADEGLFPLLPPPAPDAPPLPTAKRPPAFGSAATPAVERRLGTDDDIQLLDEPGPGMPPPAPDLPPLPLAPAPRGMRKGTPFDVRARRQFVADQLAAGKTADQAAAALTARYGLPPGQAAAAVGRFRGLTAKPAGRYDPPLALARLRGLVARLRRGGSPVRKAEEPLPPLPRPEPGGHVHTPAFKGWFGDWEADPATASKVVDAAGRPKVVFHGTSRPDRIGNEFKPGRATSGPMPFFTDDPDIAAGYATGKRDTSLETPPYEAQFLARPRGSRAEVPIDRLWHHLPPEERARVAALAPRVKTDDEGRGDIELGPEGHRTGTGGYDHHIVEARGNHLKALVEEWLNSGNLFNSEGDFLDVLRHAGVTTPVRYENPDRHSPGTVPVHLAIRNPLVTSAVPDHVLAALDRASRATRVRPREHGADFWDKNTRDPREWVRVLREDLATGANSHAWTSIPDWVTRALAGLGYDGVFDTGGKNGGHGHTVYVPFRPEQVKSAVANRGGFNPRSRKLHLGRLRDALVRFAKRTTGRTKKQCRNKRCKRTFLSSGPQHRYCSPNCRLSSDPGYRDGYVRGKSKSPAPAPQPTPETAEPRATRLSRLRGLLLRRYAKKRPKGDPSDPMRFLWDTERAESDTKRLRPVFDEYTRQMRENDPGDMPTADELEAVGHVGLPNAGEYAAAHDALVKLFSHPGVSSQFDPEALADAWASLNTVFSANTMWKAHTEGATKAISDFVRGYRAGSANDPPAVRGLAQAIKGVAGMMPEKRKKMGEILAALVTDPRGFRYDPGLIAKDGTGKTPNFGASFSRPDAYTVDQWMGAVRAPDGFDPAAMVTDPGRRGYADYTRRAEAIQRAKNENTSNLTRGLIDDDAHQARKADLEARQDLLDRTHPYARMRAAQKWVMNNPTARAAYKQVGSEVADRMGLEPRAGQEAVWSGVLLNSAAKTLFGPGEREAHLRAAVPAAVRAAWDMRKVLGGQKGRQYLADMGIPGEHVDRVMRDYGDAQQKRQGSSRAALSPPKPLREAYLDATARVPPMPKNETYNAIAEAIKANVRLMRRRAATPPG